MNSDIETKYLNSDVNDVSTVLSLKLFTSTMQKRITQLAQLINQAGNQNKLTCFISSFGKSVKTSNSNILELSKTREGW